MERRQIRDYLSYFSQMFPYSGVGLLILLGIILFRQFILSDVFLITTVRIYGAQQVNRQLLQMALIPLVRQGFFNLNLEVIHDRLLQIPWIAAASVRRIWPDRIDITLLERVAVAIWNKDSLLSTTGELFPMQPIGHDKTLPHFVGQPGKQMVMLSYFNQVNQLLMPLKRHISYLAFKPTFFWKLILDNGVMILSADTTDQIVQIRSFLQLYPIIIGQRSASVIDYVDLRYTNGVAIKWKNNYTKDTQRISRDGATSAHGEPRSVYR